MHKAWVPLFIAALTVFLFALPVYAADCAFEDVNDNGVFDAGDSVVLDSAWLGGSAFATSYPFVVPSGCNHVLVSAPAPLYGVSVNAPKIVFKGQLNIASPGGTGVQLVATGPDGVIVDHGVIKSGGVNKTFSPLGRAVMVAALAGPCSILDADLEGIRPLQATNVGVRCYGDVTINHSILTGALVNVQSITGKIDARAVTGDICTPAVGPSQFSALNYPLIMIAKGDLLVDGDTLIGRFRVTLGSEDGNISTKDANVSNGDGPAGGAFVSLFPNPASIDRSHADREDFFGPSSGNLDITSACYSSPNKIQVGQGASVTGVSDIPPCKQYPADFVAVLNGNY